MTTDIAEFSMDFGKNPAYTLALLIENDREQVLNLLEKEPKNKVYVESIRDVFAKLSPEDAANSLIADHFSGLVDLTVIKYDDVIIRPGSILSEFYSKFKGSETSAKGNFFQSVGNAFKDVLSGFGQGLASVITPVTTGVAGILSAPKSVTQSATGAAAVQSQTQQSGIKNMLPIIIGMVIIVIVIFLIYKFIKK